MRDQFELLMAEYDPRPSTCNREHAFEKLRKSLPWPCPTGSTATGRGTNNTTKPRSVSAQHASSRGHRAHGGVGKGVWRGETASANRREQEPTRGIMQNSANIVGLDAEVTQDDVDSDINNAVRMEHDDTEGLVEPQESGRPVVGEAINNGHEMVGPANVTKNRDEKTDGYSKCVSDTNVPIRPTTVAADVGGADPGGDNSDTALRPSRQSDRTGRGRLTISPGRKERDRSPQKVR